jgi:hypothetical protein
MRLAKKRSSSGAMAPSSLETTYHDGFTYHAALVTCELNADTRIGPCVA